MGGLGEWWWYENPVSYWNLLNFKLMTKIMHCFCHIAVLALKFISSLVIHARLLRAAFLESYTTVYIVKEVMKRGNLSQKSSEDKKSVIHKTKPEHNKIWFS